MTELSLNVAPSPELLKPAAGASPPAAPGRIPAGAGETAGAPNPFAALLSGILQGAQPLPEGPAPGVGMPAFSELAAAPLQPDASAAGPDVLALPGTPTALPAIVNELAGGEGDGGRPAGNPLPGTGKELPLELAAPRTAPDATSSLAARATPPAASRPRIFLADLALSRPLEAGAGLPSLNAGDAGRMAATAALAGRAVAPASPMAGETSARPGNTAPGIGSAELTGVTIASDGLGGVAPAGSDAVFVRSTSAELLFRSSGLPGAGTEFLAAQLAAFATSNESSTGPGLSALTGTGATDAGSGALLGRLDTTGLPPLQPLGEAGAFAGGLADRLLTLGGPGAHSARLKLHPEHLGELNVEISIEDGNAQVWFGTTTSQAREAIEGSLPRLRELFADQGIQLTRTQVDAGGGQMGNSGFGQERRMTGGAGPWNDAPAWQPGRPGGSAGPDGGAVGGAPARLLDVWA